MSGEKGERAKAILLEIRLPMSVDCGDDLIRSEGMASKGTG